MWETVTNNLPQIIAALLAVGVIWKYLSKIMKVAKEIEELLAVLRESLADGKITQSELTRIVKEAKDIPDAIREATKKKE